MPAVHADCNFITPEHDVPNHTKLKIPTKHMNFEKMCTRKTLYQIRKKGVPNKVD